MDSTALPNARLGALATAVPEHVLNQEDVMRGAAKLFQGSFHDFDRLIPVFKNAAIGMRYSCVPIDWYLQEHSFAERNALFVENAVDLLEKAVLRCLESAGLAIDEVDSLVIASTSGIAAPSLDALLVERLQMRRNVQRLPIFGLGCAGGVIGLALTNAFVFQPLDMLTLLGFVILIGIVVNNAILLVHQTLLHIKDEGMNVDAAILEATRNRIRPIFMSTLTSIFGMMPLVLFPGAGSELYRGLGSVVLGGLSFSAILTLAIVPPLLTLVAGTLEKSSRRSPGAAKASAAE